MPRQWGSYKTKVTGGNQWPSPVDCCMVRNDEGHWNDGRGTCCTQRDDYGMRCVVWCWCVCGWCGVVACVCVDGVVC